MQSLWLPVLSVFSRVLLAFAPASPGAPDWQGVSRATWDRSEAVIGGGFFGAAASAGGSLKVVTTAMKPGYLRRNGVPYGSSAVITEYFDRFDIPGGDALLVVQTEVVDPMYLSQPFWTSTHFKRQADATGSACRACCSSPAGLRASAATRLVCAARRHASGASSDTACIARSAGGPARATRRAPARAHRDAGTDHRAPAVHPANGRGPAR